MNNAQKLNALQARQEDLFKLLKDFSIDSSIGDKMELIAGAFYSRFLFLVDADPYRTVDPAKEFLLKESHITDLFSTLQLMVQVAKIQETWKNIEQIQDKEVDHD
ncbi:hypothetical protein [Spirosoma koreense]